MKTEKLISEMDAELIAAEDNLDGLKEVFSFAFYMFSSSKAFSKENGSSAVWS